jgi:protein TonB
MGESPKLAWINSICLLFLVVGIVGATIAHSPTTSPVRREPIAMVVGLMAESTLATPAPEAAGMKDLPTTSFAASAPQPERWLDAQASVPVPPALTVPAIGPVLKRIPFVDPSPGSSSTAAPGPESPEVIGPTGHAGARPSPPYPTSALSQRQQGAVTLLLLANDAGGLSDVWIFTSSGHSILDRSARDYIRRHWTVPSGRTGRQFQVTIEYKLSDPRPAGSGD